MSILGKTRLYAATVCQLKPSQVAYRLWRRLGGATPLSRMRSAHPVLDRADITRIPALAELDFDPEFLGRFDVDALLEDRVELLHHEMAVDWRESWHDGEAATPLWRFNLHYCEYVLPLLRVTLETGDVRYFDKAKDIIDCWISANPLQRRGVGWDPYVISMRVTNWLAFCGEARELLEDDPSFIGRMNVSLSEQYIFLARHLEKDILANHYLENLKALVLLARYFDDEPMLRITLRALDRQIREQILPDGMHFELSPMYHKVMLESLLRVASALDGMSLGGDVVSRCRLQDMCDCLYSLERKINRTPLFNDGGDNVAKSRDALLSCAASRFGVAPVFKDALPDAGYFIIERDVHGREVKAICDGGQPGPCYAAGHVHCDMLSFEVFLDGEPWLVNSGTFAYQNESRLCYKRTLAHNAPCVEGEEQTQCWASFRTGRMAEILTASCHGGVFRAKMRDWRGNIISRCFQVTDDGVKIADEANAVARIASAVHVSPSFQHSLGSQAASYRYSPEFGKEELAACLYYEGHGSVVCEIPWPDASSGCLECQCEPNWIPDGSDEV